MFVVQSALQYDWHEGLQSWIPEGSACSEMVNGDAVQRNAGIRAGRPLIHFDEPCLVPMTQWSEWSCNRFVLQQSGLPLLRCELLVGR